MVYFLQPVDGGPIKIGYSANVEVRTKQLEAHFGKPLALLAVIPGERETEQEIHERFAHLRLGKTEQFRPARDLMEFIGKPLLVDANADAVEAMLSTQGTTSTRIPADVLALVRIAAGFTGESQVDFINRVLLEQSNQAIKRGVAKLTKAERTAKD